MYIPTQFQQHIRSELLSFMRKHSFATLVSASPAAPLASHLPLLIDEHDGQLVLRGHMARDNPQWRDHPLRVLAIFSGPHSYISPTWYEAENTVPTWDYLSVHAVGTLRLEVEEDSVRCFFADLARVYEGERAQIWQARLGSETFASFVRQIVCFRIQVEDLQGAWKLNQNHPELRRHKVIASLRARGDEDALAIADAMAATIKGAVVSA
jgi:transcriptional regulator